MLKRNNIIFLYIFLLLYVIRIIFVPTHLIDSKNSINVNKNHEQYITVHPAADADPISIFQNKKVETTNVIFLQQFIISVRYLKFFLIFLCIRRIIIKKYFNLHERIIRLIPLRFHGSKYKGLPLFSW
jgi:hypothetical protein